MTSASGRWVVVFNGEIYNYRDLASDLPDVRWRGHSDTEVLVESIERWGVRSAVRRFNGMFAFAAWDRHERRLFLVRDRVGIKPLFAYQTPGTLLFASELTALLEHPDCPARLSARAVFDFFAFGYTAGSQAILSGSRKVLPGTIETYRRPGPPEQIERYWSIWDHLSRVRSTSAAGHEQDVVEELENRISESVRRRLISDVPVGAFLSGGIDSSTVVSLLQAQVSVPVRTFSIAFSESRYDESDHADAVASRLGTRHRSLVLSQEEAADIVRQLPIVNDEPFSDSSQIATVLVSRLARSEVIVSLSGDGGDELFGGYDRYRVLLARWRRMLNVPDALRHRGGSMLGFLAGGVASRSLPGGSRITSAAMHRADQAFRLARYLRSADPSGFYLAGMTLEVPWLFARGFRSSFGGYLPAGTRFRMAEELSIERLMRGLDYEIYLPDDILTKVDRASMRFGLEARVPLLDHELIEWVVSLPDPDPAGPPKALLRRVLYRHLPAALFDRPKMGFGVPIENWLRSTLRPWAESLLDREAINGLGVLDPTFVSRVWRNFLDGDDYWRDLIWRVLSFQAWVAHHGVVAVVGD